MIWDHIFATYAAESPDEPVEYGVASLAGSMPGFNPLKLTFREYTRILQDASKPGPLRLRLKHFWGPPEWQRSANPAATELEIENRL